MSVQTATQAAEAPLAPRVRRRRTIGDILVAEGHLDPGDLTRALALQRRQELRLGEILLSHDMVDERTLTATIARQYGALPVDLTAFPPDPRLIDEMGIGVCICAHAVPIRRMGGATVLATARPDEFDDLSARLPDSFGTPVMAFAGTREIHDALLAARGGRMAARAASCCPERESCRDLGRGSARRRATGAAGAAAMAAAFLAAAGALLPALLVWAALSLVVTTALKGAALLAVLRPRARPPRLTEIGNLPVVSVLVPLHDEADIAERLVARLSRVDYPKELLDICLLVEADDDRTRAMLAGADLPRWMRVIPVPPGAPRTKPKALNLGLEFCRGSIIGVWDAEDAPAPDQIHRMVRHFAAAPGDVACLQGVLDYYNDRRGWLTRCFTAEYAGWFRLILPGLARLGLVVPLGGTTLFFRRDALEALGGWDAHNVTEDADLGVRLARHGWRTELIGTVTEEEATARPWLWVRQRTRWIKGYAVTWAVHMRRPLLLWRQLGTVRFLGVQVVFLGTLSQFVVAPALWSLWLWAGTLGQFGALTLAMVPVFILAEGLNLAIGILGLRKAGKGRLWWVVPTMMAYYPLASLAAYRALAEVLRRPFHWDKTAHGGGSDEMEPPTPESRDLPAVERRAAAG